MNRAWKTLVLILPLTLVASALEPVASLTSDAPFTLDGHSVGVPGVNSWPLVSGDEIDTLDFPAVLILQNGVKMQVSAHSRLKLTGTSSQPKVVVESGKLVSLGSVPSADRGASFHPLAVGTGPGPHPPISSFQ